MELVLIGLVALLTSGLTLFSGFGLGTILMPVFALFFPLPLAIAATAVVHFANNLFNNVFNTVLISYPESLKTLANGTITLVSTVSSIS